MSRRSRVFFFFFLAVSPFFFFFFFAVSPFFFLSLCVKGKKKK